MLAFISALDTSLDTRQCWGYAYEIARTHQKVSTPLRTRRTYTPTTAAIDVEAILRLLEGRWKLVIIFHLFGGQVRRFS
jgi:hypothetical protein